MCFNRSFEQSYSMWINVSYFNHLAIFFGILKICLILDKCSSEMHMHVASWSANYRWLPRRSASSGFQQEVQFPNCNISGSQNQARWCRNIFMEPITSIYRELILKLWSLRPQHHISSFWRLASKWSMLGSVYNSDECSSVAWRATPWRACHEGSHVALREVQGSCCCWFDHCKKTGSTIPQESRWAYVCHEEPRSSRLWRSFAN